MHQIMWSPSAKLIIRAEKNIEDHRADRSSGKMRFADVGLQAYFRPHIKME